MARVDGLSGRAVVPADLEKARIATVDQIAKINRNSTRFGWSAVLADDEIRSRFSDQDRHCLFPMLGISSEPPGYRCYLWFAEASGAGRSLIHFDVSEADLRAIPIVPDRFTHEIIGMLLSQLPSTVLGGDGGWSPIR